MNYLRNKMSQEVTTSDNTDRASEIILTAKTLTRPPTCNLRVYFSIKGEGTAYNLDSSCIRPSAKVMVAVRGRLLDNYKKELESLLFGDINDKDMMKVKELCDLYLHFDKDTPPIRVVSAKFVRLLPEIVATLNTLFITHEDVISSVTTMFYNLKTKDTHD